MADIASRITDILNSEEGMNQLRTIANSLGLAGNSAESAAMPNLNSGFGGGSPAAASPPPAAATPDSNPLAALSGLFGGAPNPSPPAAGGGINIDPAMIIKLQSLMSSMNTTDSNTQLLLALKEHLSEERQKKVDDAIKIMRLVKLLPVIKEMGLFGGDDK